MSGVLAVVAHPDDETLIAGGVLARCAQNGVPARVLCLTRGELGGGEDPQRTAGLREQELARATAELGAEAECLRHPDGELPWADVDAVADEVAARIEAQRPDVVVTFGEDGLYHHPDHVATNAIVLEAARRCGDPAVACAVWPAGHMTALVAVDVRPQLGRKLRALRCHASQFGTGHLLFDLPSDLAGEYLGWEFFEPGGGERIAEVAGR